MCLSCVQNVPSTAAVPSPCACTECLSLNMNTSTPLTRCPACKHQVQNASGYLTLGPEWTPELEWPP